MSAQHGGPTREFAAGFLDDYYAECEEHLLLVRQSLLALEEGGAASGSESTVLEDLFRSFHSVKGLSAMVDLREAERLAHELESSLRALRDGVVAVTSETVTMLIDATAVLESTIAARRSGRSAPAIDGVLARLAAQSAGRSAGPSTGAAAAQAQGGGEADGPAWRLVFVPSPALVDRGVKVDTIRARLGSVGRIRSVAPEVTPQGGIAFVFVVTGPADASVFAPWRDDGLTWERGRVPTSSPTAASATGPEDAPAGPPADAVILAPSHVVRVDLKRLDDVMRRVGDLVVTRARLDAHLSRLERVIPPQEWRALQENTQALERQLRDLREDVMRVRLVRIDEIFRRMPFVARDVAREAGKDVRVVLSGQETEIDKFLVERMMDPVLHLVRNAVSHGIEDAELRVAAGKPATGVVMLRASTLGETVLLEVADDGAGIDVDRVVERALAAGARIPDGPPDPRLLLDLICEPGFSTRDTADRASGRGVGMAVVRTAIQELGGTLRVDTESGRGTRFVLTLPLTLAITDVLITVASGHTFAIPQSSVEEVIEIATADVRQLENSELVPYRDRSLPLVRLSALFGLERHTGPRLHAFVVGIGQEAVALGVDRVLGQREVVVRTMSDALLKIEGISGATELGDGRVVLILDPVALSGSARRGARQARTRGARGAPVAPAAARASGAQR